MNYRKLGTTDLKVSEIGLGTEYLFNQPKDVVESVLSVAIEEKINYFDVLFSVEHFLKNLAPVLKKNRNKVIIAGHLGSIEKENRPKRNRTIKGSREGFLNLLKNLQVEFVDIIVVQYVKENPMD
jgi:aryl-alcohol dehydrogenase-like predicted oxidoreductase